jgi:hypothetical protein
MRKLFNWTSILLITGSVIFIGWLWRTDIASPISVETLAFPAFPQGQTKLVEFDTSSESYQALSPREKKEQQRDWLLYSVVTSSNLPALQLEEALYDLPPVRSDTLANLGQAETGEARSRVLGSKKATVVALIPKADSKAQADLMSDIADEQRKNSGEMPERIYVFQYELLPDGEAARVAFLGVKPGESLFGPDAGYVEERIQTLADLERFLKETDDLVFSRLDGKTLVVGGRKLKSRQMKDIGIEEIATIWKSSQKNPDRLGFSLDPEIDQNLLRLNFAKIGVGVGSETMPKLPPIGTNQSAEKFSAKPSDLIRQRLRSGNLNEQLTEYHDAFLAKYETRVPKDALEAQFRELIIASRFQKARYDGEFQGTEVGMVLFYTDLIMKLWGQDQFGSTPRSVPEFPNQLTLNPSSVHEKEANRLTETRLWLGLRESALQKAAGGNSLYLARIATRLFAVPHDSIGNKDLKEAEPAVFDRVFIGWWNQHYSEVAQYEPQYERLNQIIKWSVLIGWLHEKMQSQALQMLTETKQRNDYWFPEWVRTHNELTFRQWRKIGFLQKGYGGTTTEALAIQYSRPFPAFGRVSQFSGGVSLAGKSKVTAVKTLSEDLAHAARRGGMSATEMESGIWKLVSQTGNSFETKGLNSGAARSVITVGQEMRLRGVAGELKALPFERTFAREAEGAALQFRTGDATVGELRIARTANGLKAGWQARDLDTAYALAKDMSRAPDSEVILLGHPDIAGVVRRTNGEHLVQLRGSKEWVYLSKRSRLSEDVEKGFHGRASNGPTDPIVDFGLVKSSEIEGRLSEISYVEVQAASRASEGVSIVEAARPPPEATRISLQVDGHSVEGLSHGNRVFVNWKSLPSEVRANPGRLSVALNRDPSGAKSFPLVEDFKSRLYSQITNKIAEDPKSFRTALNDSLDRQLSRNIELLRQKRFDELQQNIRTLQAYIGDLPEFRLHKALAYLEEGKTDIVARTLESTWGQPFKRSSGFLKELDARLADPSISPQKRANLQAIKDYAELSSRKNPKVRLGAETEKDIIDQKDVIHLRYESEELKQAKYIYGNETDSKLAAIYVEDSPALNISDWTPSNAPTRLKDWIQSGRVEVTQIQDVDLANFRPSMLVDAKTRAKYRLANSGMGSSVSRSAQTRCSQNNSGDDNRQPQPCLALMVRPSPATVKPAA